MAYLVLARKYRPQTFSEVVKQDHVTRTLAQAIASERVAHAILFSGPRGTGKTTVARILAKAMNCAEGPTPEPCNRCRSCQEITRGNAADVFEIDGASNNSVDQIRELRENVKYMPSHSRFKIYIIDEVHMLSVAAFNALLKTLEEPPAHVMFVFATTEVHKIPITILSRCQRHDFRLVDTGSICSHMKALCEKEGVEIAHESLWLIAREACGSIRDSLSLLDQVMTCARDAITHELVLDMLGVIDRKIIFDLADAVLQGDISTILDQLDEICSRGYDIRKLYADLMEHFRNLLVVKLGKDPRKLVDHPAHEIEAMRNQAKGASPAFLNQIFDILFREEPTLRFSSQPRLSLEMVFIRMFQIKPALPIDLLIERLESLRTQIDGGAGGGHFRGGPAPPDEPKPRHDPAGQRLDPGGAGAENKRQPEADAPPASDALELPDQDLAETWLNLVEKISDNSPALVANLRKCVLKKISEQTLEIEVADNGFNLSMIRRGKNMTVLKEACKAFFGKPMEILLTVNEDREGGARRKEHMTRSKLEQEALSHPLVMSAMEIFDGKVVEVKIRE